RYTKAVDQLGNADPAVRLGGLYALERIALDSNRDRDTICEVLAAYVRHRTSWDFSVRPETAEEPNRDKGWGPEVQRQFRLPAHLVDVRTALSILMKYQGIWGVDINLTGANLSGANLAGANLAGVNLHGANLS